MMKKDKYKCIPPVKIINDVDLYLSGDHFSAS